MYDYIFKNALIADGTGAELYRANVATFAGSIAFIGKENITRGKIIVNADGMILAPGFIDMHTHMDLEILKGRSALARIGQGITTDVSGNCGVGVFPASPYLKSAVADVLGTFDGWAWSGYESYKSYVSSGGVGTNQVYLVSHSAIRYAVMGDDSGREASEEEVEKMAVLLDQELKAGAYGFSTGLYYAPCVFAGSYELEKLLEAVKNNDKLFAVHHRCEGNDVVESLKEVLDLALKSGVRIEISHLKAIGVKNQDKVDILLSMIDEYREKGVEVTFDQYPYTFGSTSLFSLLPPHILAFSRLEQRLALALENTREELREEILNPVGWDSVYEMVGPDGIRAQFLSSHPEYSGKTLSEIGNELGKDPLEALFDILSEEKGLAVMTDVTTTDENIEKIMRHPQMCFGTDALYSSPIPHPRSHHCAVELLSKYVRDRKTITVEEAIKRMTSLPAERLRLGRRGLVKEGYAADLVLFDLEKLEALPDGRNAGISYVLVNGKAAMADGKLTGELAGKVL